MKAFITTLLALGYTVCVFAFNAASPRNQYYIPGVENDKPYAIIHLSSNDESFATCDTLLLVNFRNVRQLDFILDSRPAYKYEKVILADPLDKWESAAFKSSGRNVVAYSLRIERGELIVTKTYVFFLRSYAQFLGAIFILLFVVKGLVFWAYLGRKTKYILGRFTVAQVNGALLVSIGLVAALSVFGSSVSTVVFVLLMLIASVLMFLSELTKLKTSVLSKNRQFAVVFLSNLAWFLVATYPLMGITPSI